MLLSLELDCPMVPELWPVLLLELEPDMEGEELCVP